jgi:hypothetical protein
MKRFDHINGNGMHEFEDIDTRFEFEDMEFTSPAKLGTGIKFC